MNRSRLVRFMSYFQNLQKKKFNYISSPDCIKENKRRGPWAHMSIIFPNDFIEVDKPFDIDNDSFEGSWLTAKYVVSAKNPHFSKRYDYDDYMLGEVAEYLGVSVERFALAFPKLINHHTSGYTHPRAVSYRLRCLFINDVHTKHEKLLNSLRKQHVLL